LGQRFTHGWCLKLQVSMAGAQAKQDFFGQRK
jgi:hypothetical protein